MARESPDAPIILILDGRDSFSRQRYTLAHMLGHYVQLKENGGLGQRFGFVEDTQDLSIRTKDATRFAHELLMPEEAIRIWCRGGISINIIRAVLDVPKSVLRGRIRDLELSPMEDEKQY